MNQTETFAGTVTLSNGQSQTVQPTWQSDNTTVLTFENGGVARGRSNGTATIIGTNQGLTATRLIRVATDYQGTWAGEYVVRRCEDSGDFRDIDFCDREDGFYVGEVLELGLMLQQDRDQVNGQMALGSLEGITSGSVDANGRYVGTGSVTVSEDGISLVFAVSPLSFNADGDRLTGTFSVTVTAVGLTGQGVLDAELTTMVRTASGVLPTGLPPTRGQSPSAGGLKGLVNRLKR
ncbi:MAG: hypothetical protein JJE40_08875 [Vicinamibacteria bacterium]|nr:hypothetical protein [Vicinamibacteria bacterium]